jgi:hypothetical protein
MADELSTTERNIARSEISDYGMGRIDSDRICLIGLATAEISDQATNEHRDSLINSLIGSFTGKQITLFCTVGTCEVSMTSDTESGNTLSGECVATDYCLEEKFAESGNQELDSEFRRTLYRGIMDTCGGFASKENAGNFCPKIDCDLSAGFSIDGAAGTSGECAVTIRANSPQQKLDV